MKKFANGRLRTWIEIDTRAVAHNYRTFRKLLGPKVKLMAVVKSNAYGHGLVDFSHLLTKLGVDWLGVDSIVEAVALRRAGIKKDILVLGYTRPINFSAAYRNDIAVTISSLNSLRQLLALARPPQFHLKIDTGMHRQGLLLEDFKKLLSEFKQFKPQGLYSHLAVSAGNFQTATKNQIKEFEKFSALVSKHNLIKHLVATGGAIGYPRARFNLARIGVGLYGLWPNESLRRRFGRKIKLHPALTWKTIISEIKTLPRSGRVGYDFTEAVGAGTKIAICPVGYWHGYPRALSSRGRVFVNNQSVKVIGRVSMDMVVIDVTKVKKLKVGDTVTLLGDGLPAELLATRAQTSSYEIITRLNPLIERFYL